MSDISYTPTGVSKEDANAYHAMRTKINGEPKAKDQSTVASSRKLRKQKSKNRRKEEWAQKSPEEKERIRQHRRKVRAEEAALKEKRRQRQRDRESAKHRALENRRRAELESTTEKAKSLISSASKSIARMQEIREQRELRRQNRMRRSSKNAVSMGVTPSSKHPSDISRCR